MNYSLSNMLSNGGSLNADGLSLDLAFALDKTLTARKGSTPTFIRATPATFIGSNGLIQSAAINVPRFDHDPVTGVCRGLLIEESRQNVVPQSNDWTLSAWTGTATRTRSIETAPNGTTLATLATSNAVSFGGLVRSTTNITSVVGTTYTISAFVKKGNHSFVAIDWFVIRNSGSMVTFFNLDTNAFNANGSNVTGRVEDYSNGWKRISVTGTATSIQNASFDAWLVNSDGQINTNVAGRTAHWWGAQLEIGAFASSYIPTTTGALIRSADVCSITGGNFTSFYNQDEGTISVNAATPASGDRTVIGIDNNTADEMIRIRTESTNPFYKVTDAGSDVVALDLGTVVARTPFKIASTYKLNDFAASFNGASVSIYNVGIIPTVDRLRIGQGQAGNITSGHIARIQYFRKRLSNAKLITLTT